MVKPEGKSCPEAKSTPRRWENEDLKTYFPSSMGASLASYEMTDKAMVTNSVLSASNNYIPSVTCNAADILNRG